MVEAMQVISSFRCRVRTMLQSFEIRKKWQERESTFGCDVLLRYGIQRHLLQLCHGKEYQTHGNSSESESCSVPEIKIAFLASIPGDLRQTWMSKRDHIFRAKFFMSRFVVFNGINSSNKAR